MCRFLTIFSLLENQTGRALKKKHVENHFCLTLRVQKELLQDIAIRFIATTRVYLHRAHGQKCDTESLELTKAQLFSAKVPQPIQ
jgi:hypothetical protein